MDGLTILFSLDFFSCLHPVTQRRPNTYRDEDEDGSEGESDEGFIVDDDELEDEDDWRKEIRQLTGYDPRK